MNNVNVIVSILVNSSAFKCKHITYEIKGENVEVQYKKEGNFYATEIITLLSAFSSYIALRDDRITLVFF